MKRVYVIDVIRTAIGKYGGALSSVRPDDMLAHVIRSLIERNPSIDVNAIEDVIAGDANQAGEDNRNVARMVALLAGLPVSVAGENIKKMFRFGVGAERVEAEEEKSWGSGNIISLRVGNKVKDGD